MEISESGVLTVHPSHGEAPALTIDDLCTLLRIQSGSLRKADFNRLTLSVEAGDR